MRHLAYALAAGLLFATRVAATIINVTTTTDKFGSGTGCSLREAIYAADHNAAVSDCPAGSASDTIIVPSGTYTLTIPGSGENQGMTGDLDYWWSGEPLNIQGAGSGTTVIDGNRLDRVFDIGPGFPVLISGVTIRNGSVAG